MSSAAVARHDQVDPLAFMLDKEMYRLMTSLSNETGVPPDRLMRIALRMLAITAEARSNGRRVVVTSNSNYPIEELIIPR